jgi:hypothetical protein
VTNFSLIIAGELVGTFNPPAPASLSLSGGTPFAYRYYCEHCGEVFATRTGKPGACWVMLPSTCLSCAKPARVLDWIFFRLPCEQEWEPLPILAYECLYNFEAFEKELTYECSSTADAGDHTLSRYYSGAEDYLDGRQRHG